MRAGVEKSMIATNRMRGVALATVVLAMAGMASAAEPEEIALWSGTAPGSERSTLKEEYENRPITDGTATVRDRSVKGVTKPSMTVYLPDNGQRVRTAVLLCPGGAFSHLAIDKEGHDVARWLAAKGIAGIVLKYRMPDREAQVYVRNGAVLDVQRAIRLIRHRAGEWNLASDRIGVMGFSAGGYLAALAGTLFDTGNPQAADPVERESCRPDFITPVYPLISLSLHASRGPGLIASMLGPDAPQELLDEFSPDMRAKPRASPTFLVHAADDNLSAEHSLRFSLALLRAKVPVELHLYATGRHGFGIRERGLPVSAWKDRWFVWLTTTVFPNGENATR